METGLPSRSRASSRPHSAPGPGATLAGPALAWPAELAQGAVDKHRKIVAALHDDAMRASAAILRRRIDCETRRVAQGCRRDLEQRRGFFRARARDRDDGETAEGRIS